MENDCHFVCSRGLLKSCDIHSQNPKSSCNNDTNYLIEMLKNNKLEDGMSIYVCSDLLKYFVSYILPRIDKKFVLVTGDSDMCVPKEALTEKDTYTLLKSAFLIKWFAQNTRIQESDKIIQMPIGIDYHSLNKITPLEQEQQIIDIMKTAKPFYERIQNIHVCFSKSNDRFGQRKACLDRTPKNLLVCNFNCIPRKLLWQIMSQYAFILSPFGIGMDCHRTWEALCLGCIPIVCAPNFKKMFEDLPVLIVDDWSDITRELLDKSIEDFKIRTFNLDKLTLKYWVNNIRL